VQNTPVISRHPTTARAPAAPLAGLAAVLGVLACLLLLAPPARADCGGVQAARASHRPRTYLPPLAIGDSTMIFALPSLAAEGFDANARGCRQFPEALDLLRGLRHAHSLPHLIVIALGANGSVTDAYVNAALAILGHRRQLVLVTPRQAGGGSGSNAVTVRAEARRHPAQVHALDWVAYSAGHPSWFQPDLLHLTFTGAHAFARLLARALPLAPPPGHGPAAPPTPPVPPPNCASAPPTAPPSAPPPPPLDPDSPVITLAGVCPG
jgi:hypothetical protein